MLSDKRQLGGPMSMSRSDMEQLSQLLEALQLQRRRLNGEIEKLEQRMALLVSSQKERQKEQKDKDQAETRPS